MKVIWDFVITGLIVANAFVNPSALSITIVSMVLLNMAYTIGNKV